MTDKMREAFEVSGAGGTRKHPVSWDDPAVEIERKIWIAATALERERCALVCKSERVGKNDNEGDIAYNLAINHCVAAIRQGGDA